MRVWYRRSNPSVGGTSDELVHKVRMSLLVHGNMDNLITETNLDLPHFASH